MNEQPPKPPVNPPSLLTGRARLIRSVNSPLGFFVLALLIVEGFIFGAGKWFDLPLEWRIKALGAGIILFLIVFSVVVWLVRNHPEKLVFTEQSHFQLQAMKMYGSDAHMITGYDLNALPPRQSPTPPAAQLPAHQDHEGNG